MKRLIKTYEKTETNLVDESIYLAALSVEEAMLTAGGRPGTDYNFMDVFTLAVKLAPTMWPDIGDMDRTSGIPAEHPRSSDLPDLRPLTRLGLRPATVDALEAEGITEVDQLIALQAPQITRNPRLGRVALHEIVLCLRSAGHSLTPSVETTTP